MFKKIALMGLVCLNYGCQNSSELKLSINEDGERAPVKLTKFIDNGGWCWFQDERVIMHDGKLVVGAISGQTKGQVKVATYDMATEQLLQTTLLNENFEMDDHNAPVFCILPDNRVLATYEEHFKRRDRFHYFRLSAVNDTTKWSPEYKQAHKKTHVTYANLYYIKSEKRLYNFFRHGNVYAPFFCYSEDLGQTWSDDIQFIDDGDPTRRQRPYVRYCYDGDATIHVSFTDGHPRRCNNNIYYAKFKAGKFYRADGTFIKDLKKDGPLQPKEADLLYEAGAKKQRGWTSSIRLDQKGFPVIAYTYFVNKNDHRYCYARWDGEKWHNSEVAYGGTCFWSHEADYTGLITVDATDTNTVYLSTNVDPLTGDKIGTGHHEIYKATTTDYGKNWKWKTITANSNEDNLRPIVPPTDGEYHALLWLRGTFRSFIDYDLDVIGVIQPLH